MSKPCNVCTREITKEEMRFYWPYFSFNCTWEDGHTGNVKVGLHYPGPELAIIENEDDCSMTINGIYFCTFGFEYQVSEIPLPVTLYPGAKLILPQITIR